MIGPAGLDVGLDDVESADGIPDTISNRAAILADRLGSRVVMLGCGAATSVEAVRSVLVAAAELDQEVRDLAALPDEDDDEVTP